MMNPFARLVFVFAVSITPITAAFSDEDIIPDFSTLVLSEYGLEVPHKGLNDLAGFYDQKNKSRTEVFLKAFVMTYSPQYLSANLMYFQVNNYNADFLTDFEKSKDWYFGHIWKSKDQREDLIEQLEDKHLNFMFGYLSEQVDRRHYSYNYYFENSPKPETPAEIEYVFNYIFDRAQLNYRPAMLELAEAYYQGVKLPKSDFKSYFWYLNAAWHGADISEQITPLKYRLSSDEIKQAEKLLISNLYPNLVEEHEKLNPTLDINYRRVPPYLDEK